MLSRFNAGWACGAIAMWVYFQFRPTTAFWIIALGAFGLALVASTLAEKYLPK